MIKKPYLLLMTVLLALSTGRANALDDMCVCQTGSEPKEQVPFFIAGCEAWLQLQLCVRKKIVTDTKPLVDFLEGRIKPRSLKLGFVGHWSSADESVRFLDDQVIPVIQKYNINVTVDNSACLAVDNPYSVLNFLAKTPEGSRIQFKGNQAISSGLWDTFLPGKNNFWAKVDGKKKEVQFPECNKFENKLCYGIFQGGETGVCKDEETGEHVFLKCEGDKLQNWKRIKSNLRKFKGYNNTTVTSDYPYIYQSFDDEKDADALIEKASRDVRILLQEQAKNRNRYY